MSTNPTEAAAPPPKSKKMLIIVVLGVLVLALAGFGAFVYVSQQRAAAQFGDEDRPVAAKHVDTGPPVYLPLDNMVVNLADPGGDRVAQIGITLEVKDAATSDKVKQYLPTIRSNVLMLMSQRTSTELLQREGKEKLARAILREASRPFGDVDEEEDEEVADEAPKTKSGKKKKRRPAFESPVRQVLFSSFIVQ